MKMKITNCKINTEQQKVEMEVSFSNDLFQFKKELPLPNMNDIEGVDELISLLKDVIEYYEYEKTKNLSSLKAPYDMFDNILKGGGCIQTTYPSITPSNVCVKCYQVITEGEVYCYICKKKIKKEYYRQYYQKNKEALKQKSAEYQSKNREKANAKSKKYYEKNKQKIAKRHKEYQEKKKAHIEAYNREYYQKNKNKINLRRRKVLVKQK